MESQFAAGFPNVCLKPPLGLILISIVAMSQITSQGALCEYVRVRGDHVIHRPPNLTPLQGAGVCLAGLSAYQLLFHDAKVKKGDRILINNGSGGVGTFAIQIAKAHGCHVTTSASSNSYDLVKKLGADQVRRLSNPCMCNLTLFR